MATFSDLSIPLDCSDKSFPFDAFEIPSSWLPRSCMADDPSYLVWARRNHLSRKCGAPMEAEDITHHLQSYPISATSLTTRSPPLEQIAGTFSRNMNGGWISLAKRTISKNSPLRSPSKPFPRPATLISWHVHGKPPKMISTSSVTSGSPL